MYSDGWEEGDGDPTNLCPELRAMLRTQHVFGELENSKECKKECRQTTEWGFVIFEKRDECECDFDNECHEREERCEAVEGGRFGCVVCRHIMEV